MAVHSTIPESHLWCARDSLADAAVVLAKSTALADACATAVCNLIQDENDLSEGVESAKKIPGVTGGIIILKDKMTLWGKIKLI